MRVTSCKETRCPFLLIHTPQRSRPPACIRSPTKREHRSSHTIPGQYLPVDLGRGRKRGSVHSWCYLTTVPIMWVAHACHYPLPGNDLSSLNWYSITHPQIRTAVSCTSYLIQESLLVSAAFGHAVHTICHSSLVSKMASPEKEK